MILICFFFIFLVHLELFSQLLMLLLDRRWVSGNLQIQQRSGALLVKLNKHAAFSLSPQGRYQTDQSPEAAQEGAHHQWDSSDEGAEEP